MTDKSKVIKALKYISEFPSLRDIAKESGIDQATLTRVLKSKKEKDHRELTTEQVEKLMPVLKQRKLIK